MRKHKIQSSWAYDILLIKWSEIHKTIKNDLWGSCIQESGCQGVQRITIRILYNRLSDSYKILLEQISEIMQCHYRPILAAKDLNQMDFFGAEFSVSHMTSLALRIQWCIKWYRITKPQTKGHRTLQVSAPESFKVLSKHWLWAHQCS